MDGIIVRTWYTDMTHLKDDQPQMATNTTYCDRVEPDWGELKCHRTDRPDQEFSLEYLRDIEPRSTVTGRLRVAMDDGTVHYCVRARGHSATDSLRLTGDDDTCTVPFDGVAEITTVRKDEIPDGSDPALWRHDNGDTYEVYRTQGRNGPEVVAEERESNERVCFGSLGELEHSVEWHRVE